MMVQCDKYTFPSDFPKLLSLSQSRNKRKRKQDTNCDSRQMACVMTKCTEQGQDSERLMIHPCNNVGWLQHYLEQRISLVFECQFERLDQSTSDC